MKGYFVFCCLLIGFIPAAGATDLIISNARIIDGSGGVIQRGSVIVRNGRIDSVVEQAVSLKAVPLVDAGGKTVMPGLIDTHRHLIHGEPDEWLGKSAEQMREYLEAGFTTLFSNGDPFGHILELRSRLNQGVINGPRLYISGRVDISGSPQAVQKAVQEVTAAGVDAVKIWIRTLGPTQKTNLEAVLLEAGQHQVPVVVHVTAVPDVRTVAGMKVARLVHTPHTGDLTGSGVAELIASAGIPVSSTLGVYIPTFGKDNIARLAPGGRPASLTGDNLRRGAQGLINARVLWDAGVVYAFGTDTPYLPKQALKHELRALQVYFSPADIIAMLTGNAGVYLDAGDEIGTLLPGAVADIIIVDGNPLDDITALLNVVTVIRNGEIVVNKH